MSTHQPPSRGRTEPERLSKDTIFSMLSNRRRRYVLSHLARSSDPVSLRELAERIAAWENGVCVDELEYKQRKRVYTSLHQTHLPKLDKAGVVDYDRADGTVALAEQAAELDVYLERVGERDVPWGECYLGLSAVASLAVVGAWLGVGPFVGLPGTGLAGGVVAVFAVVAGVHAWRARRNHIGGDDAPVEDPREH
jgi:DNA-binding transcriptional ArsR family regulator